MDLPDGLQTLVVIGTYLPAQVLLLLGILLLIRTRAGLLCLIVSGLTRLTARGSEAVRCADAQQRW